MDRGIFDGHGNAQFEKITGNLKIRMKEFSRGCRKVVLAAMTPDETGCGQKTDSLTEYGGQGSAGGSQIPEADENEIQNDVEDRSAGNEIKRMPGITHATENGAGGIVSIDKQNAGHAYDGVSHRFAIGFGRRIHESHNGVPFIQASSCHKQSEKKQQQEQSTYQSCQLIVTPGPDILGYENLTGTGKSHSDKGQTVRQVPADRHCRQTGLSQYLSDNNHICHIICNL